MRAIDADELLKQQYTMGFGQMPVVSVDAIKNAPTLTPPNEPLTLEQLREMDAPVWCACKPIEGGTGYWCLCQRGHVITPAGSIFDVNEIPHWKLYRRPPEGEADE